jgi:hypothetical protein
LGGQRSQQCLQFLFDAAQFLAKPGGGLAAIPRMGFLPNGFGADRCGSRSTRAGDFGARRLAAHRFGARRIDSKSFPASRVAGGLAGTRNKDNWPSRSAMFISAIFFFAPGMVYISS